MIFDVNDNEVIQAIRSKGQSAWKYVKSSGGAAIAGYLLVAVIVIAGLIRLLS